MSRLRTGHVRRRAGPTHAERDVEPTAVAAIANADLGRRLLAEFVGTPLLVIFAPARSSLEMGHGRLDYAGLGVVAISFALVAVAVIYMFGTTSGAHINPAVTCSLAVVRRFPWAEVGRTSSYSSPAHSWARCS